MISALCAHAGLGRTVLTSRRMPEALAGMQVEAVDALSLDEALLLLRDLPHLSTLDPRPTARYRYPPGPEASTGSADIAHGHPKLLELADGGKPVTRYGSAHSSRQVTRRGDRSAACLKGSSPTGSRRLRGRTT